MDITREQQALNVADRTLHICNSDRAKKYFQPKLNLKTPA